MIPNDTTPGTPIFYRFDLNWIKAPLDKYGKFNVGTGYIETWAAPAECYPCEREFRYVADHFKTLMDGLHRDFRTLNLNFPDIARWMEDKWTVAADAVPPPNANKEEWATTNARMTEATEFVNAIRTKAEELKREAAVQGVPLFRR